uniref:IKAROS family zinc finger 2 n=1 Tax=Gallus gallus TaxID=9031 RepID=A0A8V0YC96_CHICK
MPQNAWPGSIKCDVRPRAGADQRGEEEQVSLRVYFSALQHCTLTMEAEAADGYITCDNELSPEREHSSMAIDLTSSTPNGQHTSPSHVASKGMPQRVPVWKGLTLALRSETGEGCSLVSLG